MLNAQVSNKHTPLAILRLKRMIVTDSICE